MSLGIYQSLQQFVSLYGVLVIDLYLIIGHRPEFHLDVFSAVDTPYELSVKLNCDTAFKNSKAAFGIVVRDSTGYQRYVLGKPCHAIPPLHAKIIAVHYACSLASDRGWFNATMESDSQLAFSLACSEATPPWCLATLVDDIRLWANNMQISLTTVEFPKFNGDDVISWLYKVNKFFKMDLIEEDEEKIRLVSMLVFGKALNWHTHFTSRFGEVVTWEVYQIQVKKRGKGNVTKNDTTMLVQNTHMPNRAFNKLTQQELEGKKAKHLCSYCDQRKGVMSTYTTSLIDEPPLISLNALTGENSYRTIRVRAYVRKNMVNTLVDCESTHNFLDLNIVKKLGCKLWKICPLEVSVANRHVMSTLYECKGFFCEFQGVTYTADVMILPLKGCEMADLAEFDSAFDLPKELPPKRTYAHRIPLVPNTPLVNIRPYKHPPKQKDAIELMVKELLESGQLNKAIMKDKFPILVVEELNDEPGDSKFFSKLDLRKFVLAFFDDILIYRHIISSKGITTDASKIQAMKEWPIPKNVKQLRGFLGLTSYYRKFIKDYAVKSRPLTVLLKKIAFQWRMLKMVKQAIRECDVCQREKPNLSAYPGLLQPLPIPEKIWSLISMDFIEKLPSSHGNTIAYGQTPPLHIPYVNGETMVETVNITMREREESLQMVKFHLKRAQDKMVSQANKHRIDIIFEVGMWVYLKFQPHRKETLRKENQYKLSSKNYGLFMILKRIGAVAYKLELPSNSQVHLVFHVSQLKLCQRSLHKSRILPHCVPNGVLSAEPVIILDRRLAKVNNKALPYVLVKGSNHTYEDATWENYADLI
uniref:Retrotransposable element Tf2 n=1 Tax=Tanacetum cinerariifolium TaxID=118510 RepID=A0A699HIG1_TANCI|nr:retrotransposable element Tf2 [Tanacetum cinerariifolium]